MIATRSSWSRQPKLNPLAVIVNDRAKEPFAPRTISRPEKPVRRIRMKPYVICLMH